MQNRGATEPERPSSGGSTIVVPLAQQPPSTSSDFRLTDSELRRLDEQQREHEEQQLRALEQRRSQEQRQPQQEVPPPPPAMQAPPAAHAQMLFSPDPVRTIDFDRTLGSPGPAFPAQQLAAAEPLSAPDQREQQPPQRREEHVFTFHHLQPPSVVKAEPLPLPSLGGAASPDDFHPLLQQQRPPSLPLSLSAGEARGGPAGPSPHCASGGAAGAAAAGAPGCTPVGAQYIITPGSSRHASGGVQGNPRLLSYWGLPKSVCDVRSHPIHALEHTFAIQLLVLAQPGLTPHARASAPLPRRNSPRRASRSCTSGRRRRCSARA